MFSSRLAGSCAPFAVLVCLILSGCGAKYVTPGPAADLSRVSPGAFAPDPRDASTPGSLRAEFNKQPLAQFPVSIAVARLQGSGYRSYSCESYGSGDFSVVTSRDVETSTDFDRLSKLAGVRGIAPLNRLLLPRDLSGDTALRRAAASLHADMLLLYTFDTEFREDDAAPPLGFFSLGLLPTKGIKVRSTAAALLIDTRSGFVYATAEGTANAEQIANGWTSEAAADQSRKRAERRALDDLLNSLESAWPGVTSQHAGAGLPPGVRYETAGRAGAGSR